MTLYYTMVFMILLAEMGIFLLLVVPLPFTWRKKLFQVISESPVIAKLQYGLKITFIFILILFIDSVNRVYRVTTELSESKNSGNVGTMGPERMEVQARKFYSQRNMYLCGFTLFLSLILNRTYWLILDVLRLEDVVNKLRANDKKNGGVAGGDAQKQIEELRAEVKRKDNEVKAMKQQAEGLSREYGDLSDKYAAATSTGEKVNRKDL